MAGTKKITEILALPLANGVYTIDDDTGTGASLSATKIGNDNGGLIKAAIEELKDLSKLKAWEMGNAVSAKINAESSLDNVTYKVVEGITTAPEEAFAIAFAAKLPLLADFLAGRVFIDKNIGTSANVALLAAELAKLAKAELEAHPLLKKVSIKRAADTVDVTFDSILCEQLVKLGDPTVTANFAAAKLTPVFAFLHASTKVPADALENADTLLAEYLATDEGKKLNTKPLLTAFLAEVAKVDVGSPPAKVFADIAKQAKVAAVLGKLPEKILKDEDTSLNNNKKINPGNDGKTESIAVAFDKAGFGANIKSPQGLMIGTLIGAGIAAVLAALMKYVFDINKLEALIPAAIGGVIAGILGNAAVGGLGSPKYVAGEITAESSKATIDDADNRKFIAEAIGAKSIDDKWMVTQKEGETPVPFNNTHRETLEGKVGGDAKGKWAKVVEGANSDKTKTAESGKSGKTPGG